MRPGDERAAGDADRAAHAQGWDKGICKTLTPNRRCVMHTPICRVRNAWTVPATPGGHVRERGHSLPVNLSRGMASLVGVPDLMGSGHDQTTDDFDGAFD